MQIKIRADNSVEIEGYVNAVERDSRVMQDRTGTFVECVKAGAFKRALDRNPNINVLLNHKEDKILAKTTDGTTELTEDAIGLKCRCVVTDSDVVSKARAGKLRGWSFGYYDVPDGVAISSDEGGLKKRSIKDLDLVEVSIIDDTMLPCYVGTLINVRAGKSMFASETLESENKIITDDKQNIDYTEYENTIENLREDF